MSNSLTATSAVSKQNIQTTWIDTLTFTTKNKTKMESSPIDEPLKKKPKPPAVDEDFFCQECGINFTRKGNLKRHTLNKHCK